MAKEEVAQCPQCGMIIFQDYPSPDFDSVRLAYCKFCGLGFPTRFVTDKELREYYEADYRPTRNTSEDFLRGQERRADEQYEYIRRFGTTSSITYDIGCGSGALLRKFGGKLYGSEWDAALHVPGISYTENTPPGAELVIMSHTLEHLADPGSRLKEIYSKLSPNGAVFIEVPNVPFSEFMAVVSGKYLLGHLFHFTPGSLWTILQKAGFSVATISTHGPRMRFTSKSKLVRRVAEKFFTPRALLRAIARKASSA